MSHVRQIVNSGFDNSSNGFESVIKTKIDDFYILYIYDQEERNDLKNFAKEIVKGEKESIPLYNNRLEGETFIITEATYKQNKNLFYKLRLAARDDVLKRIVQSVTAYFLADYAKLIQTSIPKNPELKSIDLLDKAVEKIHVLLENDTFLKDESAWEGFYSSFKTYLTKHIIRETQKELGKEKMEKMSRSALNELFYQRLEAHTKIDSPLMKDSITTIETYLQQWIDKIIPSLHDQHPTNQDLELFLGLKKPVSPVRRKLPLPITLKNNHLSVMSNVVYQSIREALSNQYFMPHNDMPWPTAKVDKRTAQGIIQIKPKQNKTNNSLLHQAWKQADTVAELEVDVFDALCSFFISNAAFQKDIVEIKVQDLLLIRGIKAKKGGSNRRGGFERKQITQILKALAMIQNIWVQFNQVTTYEKGKQVKIQLEGRTFIFLDAEHKACDIAKLNYTESFYITVDDVFSKFLRGSGRQTALLPIKTLKYNPHQEKWEKKMMRYLSWRWRTQARKKNFDQSYKIATVLEAIGMPLNTRTPSRTRERLELALDKLQEDGLVAVWEYVDWDESVVMNHGWARLWENTRLMILPPKVIKEHYQTISQNKLFKITPNIHNKAEYVLDTQLKAYRKKLGLTLKQAAEEIEVSPVYISLIERGERIPSPKVANRILNWIQ